MGARRWFFPGENHILIGLAKLPGDREEVASSFFPGEIHFLKGPGKLRVWSEGGRREVATSPVRGRWWFSQSENRA